jgi:hypothetical protein
VKSNINSLAREAGWRGRGLAREAGELAREDGEGGGLAREWGRHNWENVKGM